MKFFIENQEVEEEVNAVLANLKLRMNGSTVGQMQERGIKYRLNYGVSFQHLRELSLQITPSIELAERLWFLEIRETMLLSAMIVPRAEFTYEMAREWSQLVNNIDLVERTALLLWGNLSYADRLIEQWSASENEWLHVLSNFTLGWLRHHSGVCTSEDINQFLLNLKPGENPFLLKSQSFAIRKMLRLTLESTPELNSWLQSALSSDLVNMRLIAQEIKSEIDFVESDL